MTSRLSQVQYVKNVQSPLTGDSEVSADGHAALVGFEIAGDSTEAKDRVDPTLAAVAAAQTKHPDLQIEQFGDASANKAVNSVISDDLAKAGMLSLPITLIILIITFGTLVAAGLPLLIGITSVMAALGLVAITSHLFRPTATSRGRPADRAGGGCGILRSLLRVSARSAHPDAASAPRSRPRRHLGACRADLRRDRDSGDGACSSAADKAFISFAEGTILVVAIAVFASLTILPAMLSWSATGSRRSRSCSAAGAGRRLALLDGVTVA